MICGSIWVLIAKFLYPSCIQRPRRGWPRQNFVKMFDACKTRMIGLPYGEKNYDDMLSRFHLIPERHGWTDRRTDRWTDRQTDRIAISISRVSVLTRDKNWIQVHNHKPSCMQWHHNCFENYTALYVSVITNSVIWKRDKQIGLNKQRKPHFFVYTGARHIVAYCGWKQQSHYPPY